MARWLIEAPMILSDCRADSLVLHCAIARAAIICCRRVRADSTVLPMGEGNGLSASRVMCGAGVTSSQLE